ncbi:hypothetical protein [Cronobacter malonaticus]|uniref:hypothetical protein n=1 Tax=Cronobacter malonaticus TaxID=413503 RepID=UPI0029C00E45|nr:hypothetical protein [Cronobacter malonaticus]
MTNTNELTAKLKAAAEKAKDDFLPNMTISTRDVLELIAALEAEKRLNAELEKFIISCCYVYNGHISNASAPYTPAHESRRYAHIKFEAGRE